MNENINIDYDGAKILITVNGKVNEDTIFPTIKFTPKSSVLFDLNGLTLLNSCGIRGWISWLNTFSKSVSAVTFKNCNRIFIEQVNLIEGLVPAGGIIESYYIPYYCEKCDLVESELVESKNSADRTIFKNKKCQKCQGPMELDVMEEKYLKFLKKYSKK
ncbi:MAG: hypothetical protein A2504_09800 [Bdellovibrionales bacterium RIFOXYD12_FULL_39_22]|nr:MAG: hypothetical protein A2385_13290 [Bdellovibrionales bacterium RIFOXYB1_FULL_39_21]OFZ41019.1 MAG: hypothetical protein A2485_16800 [Bdellovibrionales bacterium RIFOXYC12_FULL_39_17]OFZ44848.1 MAG: hypothetical protein A2404_10090 [Bdellovibrionales bacterium RIFOXYC1_FULL_39_130]OFZ68013.1 MAG: hypothetical protein A2451_14145 [Bdellovibrionales bacterium RIFOXYC2_FULL_39_8]OFZ74313.1 MAG: hypothetical protein A2560_17055 [Bdellovibrionales bacterium RIFOXYD1_FULL_39_84]OFZ92177.1 MAG: